MELRRLKLVFSLEVVLLVGGFFEVGLSVRREHRMCDTCHFNGIGIFSQLYRLQL